MTVTVDYPEWDAYVRDVREAIANREVDYIGRYTELAAAGGGAHKGLSPLRSEKTPSFYVYEGGGGWYDFGSQEGGDLIAFARLYNRANFREALDILARDHGLDDWEARKKKRGAPPEDPASLAAHIEEESASARIFAAITWLARLCHQALPSSVREHIGRHYGYSAEFIDKQQIGWCPEHLWDLAHAPGEPRPFTDDELLATGWFFVRGDAAYPASLGGRIVFPYWKNGLVRYAIGREHHAGARRADVVPTYYNEHAWDAGKYKKLPVRSEKHDWVSPCVRNDVLWGEDTIRFVRDGALLITEGVTDAGILAMLGFPVISPVTVAFRNEDVERVVALLKRYRVGRVAILNDNDTTPDGKHPGLDGAKRMAAALWKEGIDTRIARLPKPEGATKVDINEIASAAVREQGEDHARGVVRAIIDSAISYPEFLLTELPATTKNEDLEPVLSELGALSARMTTMQQLDLMARVFDRFPKLHKLPARRIFRAAVVQRLSELRAADVATAGPGDAGASAATGSPTRERARTTAPELRGHVIEHPAGYYERETANGRERISSFRLVLEQRIVRDSGGPDWLCVRIEGIDTSWAAVEGQPAVVVERWPIPPKAWITKRAFLAAFPSERMQWTGSDDDVQGVYELLTQGIDRAPLVRSTGVIGRHVMPDKTLRFVVPAGTLGADGRWMREPDLVYLPDGGSNLQHRLPREQANLDDPDTLLLARELLESVLLLHEPEAIGAMVAWFAATLFGPYLRARLGVFSILNITATPGSGKTSLLQRILWPAFAGVARGELLSCTSSPFSNARDFASTNALALVMDEFKAADMGKLVEPLIRSLRRLYSGDTETRGRPDQDLNVYFQQAPVCLAGESRIEGDQAMNERCLFVTLDANWLRDRGAVRDRFHALARRPLAAVAPLFWSWSLRADADAMLAKAEAFVAQFCVQTSQAQLPERVRLNLTLCAFGAVAVDELARSLGTQVADVSLRSVFVRLLGETFDEELGAGAGSVRDYLDDVLCAGSEMAHLGLVKEGRDYAVVDGKLRLWLPGIIAALDVWRGSRRLAGTAPDHRIVRRIAREKLARGGTYVTGLSVATALDGAEEAGARRVRCLEVDPARVPASLGVEPWPVNELRSHGGTRAPSAKDVMDRFHAGKSSN